MAREQAGHDPVSEEHSAKSTAVAWSFVLKVFAASRLFYLLAGLLFVGALPVSSFQRTLDVPFGALSMWAHYDGERYVSIALYGYDESSGEASPAFFPLYPLIVRSVAELFGGPLSPGAVSVWGVLVSLTALPFALWFLYRITEQGWGEQAARGTVLILAFFPTTFFLNSVYTESLFLALSTGSVWAVRVRRDLLLACLFAGLAAATRNVGVLLAIPLIYEWWRNRHEYGWRAVYLALAPSGLLAYAGYLWWRFGAPLLFREEQAEWGRGFSGPFDALRDAFGLAASSLISVFESGALFQALGGLYYFWNLLFLLLAYVMLSVGVRWLSVDLTLYGFALVLVPVFFGATADPLLSMPRFVLVAFPIFIALGIALKDRRLIAGWLVTSVILSLAFTALFVNWYFVA